MCGIHRISRWMNSQVWNHNILNKFIFMFFIKTSSTTDRYLITPFINTLVNICLNFFQKHHFTNFIIIQQANNPLIFLNRYFIYIAMFQKVQNISSRGIRVVVIVIPSIIKFFPSSFFKKFSPPFIVFISLPFVKIRTNIIHNFIIEF